MNHFNRLILCLGLGLLPLSSPGEQLLNLPLPSDGLRYHSYAELDIQWPATHGAGSVCLWGDDRFAAVSFTIDDNIPGDHAFWRQVSHDYGWKFTWFVIVHPYMWDIYNDGPGTNRSGFGTEADFQALYNEGHEIELHGACESMNTLTDSEYEDHVARSISHLESTIGNRITTFAYPCGTLDRGDATNSFRTIIGKRLIGARGTTGGSTPPATVDYLVTKSMSTALNTGEGSNWDKMEQKPVNLKFSAYRGWAVILNHKVSDRTATLVLCDWISANESKYWVKPFSHVSRYAQERESSTLTVTGVSASKIAFTLTDRMHDGIFNVPLTVKFRTHGWTGAAAHQNGNPVPVRLVTNAGATYALVDAVPDQGPVELRATLPDTDGDGMPDLWETENGFDALDPADAARDSDKDGQSNLDEFLAGTNPTNSSSRMASWLERQGEGFAFAFSPVPPWASTLVEYSPDLVAWYPLTPSGVAKEGQVTRWTDPAPLAARRFYRLKLAQP